MCANCGHAISFVESKEDQLATNRNVIETIVFVGFQCGCYQDGHCVDEVPTAPYFTPRQYPITGKYPDEKHL